MLYIIAVFRSRTQTQSFAETMRYYGVQCSIVQTPSEARVGCGLSAKFAATERARAERIISFRRLNSFVGFYGARRVNGRSVISAL